MNTKRFARLQVRAICQDGGKTAPEWIELLPSGPTLHGRDGRTWVLDDPEQVVRAFDEDGKPLPVDYEHATEHKGPVGEPAPAVAWIEELTIRNGAVWGRVDWNEEGRRAVESRQYRYISPVFDFTVDGNRVVRLTSVGLTNTPNFTLAALNSEGPDRQVNAGTQEGFLQAVRRALGLPGDAGEEAILAAIAQLQAHMQSAQNRAENPDLTRFVPRTDYDRMRKRAANAEQALKDRDQAELDASIAKEVDAAALAGKIAPASKAYFTAMCRTQGGLDKFREFVKSAPEVVKGSGLDGQAAGNARSLTGEERAACRMMGVSARDFLNMKEDDT